MKNFLLIHGGSHGAWCYEKLQQELTELGHQSFAIDLPGSGQDPTPRNQVNIDLCAQHINNFIQTQKLTNIHLVVHSLAGLYAPSVIQHNPENITQTTFLAAVVLKPGEKLIDYIPEDRRPLYFEMAEKSPDYTFKLPLEITKQCFFEETNTPEAYHKLLTPQALTPYLETAKIDPQTLPNTQYILCSKDKALPPTLCQKFAKNLGAIPTHIEAGHNVMLSQPQKLATILSF